MIKQCSNCCYFRGKYHLGLCHRYPPVPVQQNNGLFKLKTDFEFPSVMRGDICGEWHTSDIDWLHFPPKEKK